MFEIDGSQKSGSGTILRLSVALAAITGQPLHIFNIRHNRPQPGLKPQHLEAVLTAARICNAKIQGASLGSSELWFKPQQIVGGSFHSEVGTAGNIPMLFMTVLPICIYAKNSVQLHVGKGGTDTIHAPTINYIQNVLLPTLKKMNVNTQMKINRYGYYPKGMGEVTLTVQPTSNLRPIRLENFGDLVNVSGVSVCTFLADRKVAERQANAAIEILRQKGYSAEIQIVNDSSNPIQKGSSIVLWAKTDNDVIVGADAIGELRKTSEDVGKEVAEKISAELTNHPTVDVHLADMLIPFMALSSESSVYLVRNISDHVEANIWLVEKMLNVRFKIEKIGALYRVEKLAQ